MSYLENLLIFCLNEGLNPDSPAARRRFETGAGEVTITDGRDLTMDDIDALTGELVGTFNVVCPYCGPEKPWSTRMKIERPSLASARWYCFYCGRDGRAHGDGSIDRAAEARARRRAAEIEKEKRAEKQAWALRIWNECVSIKGGDPVRRYLEARGIFELPPDPDGVLRFHPACPFGFRERRPCMVALMRDVLTDEPHAVHRTWTTDDGRALGRMALGPIARAAVKLWPLAGDTLSIGEGIETVLAAATRLKWREPPLFQTETPLSDINAEFATETKTSRVRDPSGQNPRHRRSS